jgi:hypothetical protein
MEINHEEQVLRRELHGFREFNNPRELAKFAADVLGLPIKNGKAILSSAQKRTAGRRSRCS